MNDVPETLAMICCGPIAGFVLRTILSALLIVAGTKAGIALGTAPGNQSQPITFGTVSPVTFGVTPFTIAAPASSTLAVSFASTTSVVCTVAGTTVTIVAGGTCSITATQAGNETFAPPTPVLPSFTVNPAIQSQEFAGDPR